jgi:S-layer homology domain
MNMKARSLSLAMGLGAIAAALGAQPLHPQTYGTTPVSYIEIPGVAFDSASPVASPYAQTGIFARYTAGCGGCLVAPLRLPSGAKLISLELDAADTDAFDEVFGTLWVCDRWGANCSKHPVAAVGPADCAVAGSVCSGEAFADGPTLQTADLTPDDIVVDNTQHSYLLTSWADASTAALGGMIVGYVLQVSPAPVSADFNDVPTSHPFFQFVEALYASGITAGCGNGNFCPDAPLTRGQMAVFLAKALGLQWQLWKG